MAIFTLWLQKNLKKNLAIFPQLIIPSLSSHDVEYQAFRQQGKGAKNEAIGIIMWVLY